MAQPSPPPVPADDKDWTWVVHRSCPECGFDPASIDPTAVSAMLRANASEWDAILRTPEPQVRTRPDPATWSALEYAAHVRDVHRLYLERLNLMLSEDGPHYPNWDQDETAVTSRYHESDPAEVARELIAAAAELADRFDAVEDDQWTRTGYRSDGAAFTVETFATYLIHDPIHHVDDARKGFARLAD